MSLALAQDHRAAQADLAQDAARRVVAAWAEGVDPGAIRESWRLTLPQAVGLTTAAQYAAVTLADSYLRRAVPGPVAADLNARALAGVASDGRELSTLLARPAITALSYLAGGRAVADAMAAAVAALELIVGTQVADAGRAADLVGMAARPRVVAYTRVVNLPACARCIILAGQTYPWSEGFARHPRCDCEVLPLTDDAPAPFSPRELFAQMSPVEQVRRFGAVGAEAIHEGADLAQVVNARRGMAVAGARLVTSEGMTRRGYAGRRLGSTDDRGRFRPSREPRLMPEQIIAEAAGDRDAAIEALIRYGYLTPRREEVAPVPQPEPVALAAPVPDDEVLPDPPTMTDVELESELGALMAAGDYDSPRMAVLMAEMDRREQVGREDGQAPDVELEPAPEPVPVDGRITADGLARYDDERLSAMLMEAFAEGRERDAAVIEAEYERRVEVAEAPPAEVWVDPDETDVERERREREDAQYAEMARLVEEEGYAWEQAAAEVQGRSIEAIRREAYLAEFRPAGDRRSFTEVAREQYKLYVARQYVAAEDATRGYLVTTEGRARGVDPESLFSGPRARAERWASEELKRWWDAFGRLTFEDFVAEIESGRGTDAGRDYNR
ncbi:hypothetical protein ACIRPH_30010 [Nocardiopsis sp. NPDC101807]|uniref:VG15 protein n=1 Tax=Nocardiopsis sp. NPDC101807 TaxID=3364339 RepID=UPI0038201ACA